MAAAGQVAATRAGIFILGTGTLAHGLAPRLAVPATYLAAAWSFLTETIGASLGLRVPS